MSRHRADEDLKSVLRHCADDDERERLRRLWGRLGALASPAPPPDLAARFSAALHDARANARHRRSTGWRLAAALAAGLLLGIVGTRQLAPITDGPSGSAALELQLREARHALALAALPGATATSRLTAVTALTPAAARDARSRSALAALAAADRDLNVRMLAAQGLGPHLDDPELLATLTGMLDADGEPLMNIVLLDVFVERSATTALPAIERLADQASDDPLVSEKARWAARTLRQRRNRT